MVSYAIVSPSVCVVTVIKWVRCNKKSLHVCECVFLYIGYKPKSAQLYTLPNFRSNPCFRRLVKNPQIKTYPTKNHTCTIDINDLRLKTRSDEPAFYPSDLTYFLEIACLLLPLPHQGQR